MTKPDSKLQSPGPELLEMTRWFLLSVQRHVRQEQWQDSRESGLTEQQQYGLAGRFLEDRHVRQSVRMVLRDPALQNRLVGFAGSRDVSKLILSDSTRAFQQAVAFLAQQPLVANEADDVPEPDHDPAPTAEESAFADLPRQQAAEAGEAAAIIPSRRAARRARARSATGIESTRAAAGAADSAAGAMSDEEYQRLEHALASGHPEPVQRSPLYRSNEDRFSLLAGLLAGALFFALVFWLFL